MTSMNFVNVPITSVREYWDRQPCNIRHSSAPIGTRAYFDQVEERKYFVEPHIPGFADFKRWQGRKVLEIGCGIGTDTINFARAGALVTAVDLSENSIQIARQRAQVYGLEDRIKFYAADAENLSELLEPMPYDLVYSSGVIHHTPRPDRILQQIAAHFTQPGSTLKMLVYHRYSWKVFQILLAGGPRSWMHKEEWIARHSEAQTGCPVTHTYSKKQAARLLEPDYDIEEMRVEHIFPYKIPAYREYRYEKTWYWLWLPKPVFHRLEKTWGWHLCITARKEKGR